MSNYTVLRNLTVGKVTLEVRNYRDETPDYSYIGEWSGFREPRKSSEKLVHTDSGLVLDHHGYWRDAKGRLQAAPEWEGRRYDLEFTFHDNNHTKLSDAIGDNRRLVTLGNGDWYFMGIIATVSVDGEEIGQGGIWDVESDQDDDYITSAGRDAIFEAVAAARTRVRKVA